MFAGVFTESNNKKEKHQQLKLGFLKKV